MVITEEIEFPAFTGNENRRLYVYLPVNYDGSDECYPVLYMFDGHNVFFDDDATYGKSWGLGEYLDETEAPLIVAALECHRGENLERLSEYSPYDLEHRQFGRAEGHGRETMEFFVNELKPMIDAEFRTIPDREHTFICGSSMGGLMAVYAALEYNRYFSRAAGLSPSIFLCWKDMYNLARETKTGTGTVLYMDIGTKEVGKKGRASLAGFARTLADNGIAVTYRIIPGGDHSEGSWERQLPFVIETLLYGVEI